jgi:Ca2+-binding EF-hand superfamily protein
MTRLCSWLLVFAVTGFLTSDVAAAQAKGKKNPAETKFKALDKNEDGKVSLAEYLGLKEGEAKDKATKTFRKKDKNGDGFLTLQEYASEAGKKSAKKTKKK